MAVNAHRQHQTLSPLHQQAVLRPRGHDRRSRGTVGSCVRALARKFYRSLTGRTNAHRYPDGSLKAREREDSVGLLSPPPSQPSPRASLLGSRNGSATSLARISGAFRSRSRSRNESSGSASGSGGSSRHNSHVSVSSASLALGRARAHSLIQGIGGASRSSIELVLGHMPRSSPATGAACLGDTSDTHCPSVGPQSTTQSNRRSSEPVHPLLPQLSAVAHRLGCRGSIRQ